MVTATSPILTASPLAWAVDAVRLDGQPFRAYDYQGSILTDRNPRQLILKSRQVGVTLAIAIREAHAAIFQPGSLALIVSKDQRAAADVLGRIYAIFDELDEPPELVRQNTLEAVLVNGARIVSQPATSKAGRGLTATSVVLDEAAFMEHDARIYRAVSPTLSRGGRIVVASTPNGTTNLFYRLWSDLEGGAWSKHRIHWSSCPAFDEAWYKRTRENYQSMEQDWQSEYECDFVESGGAIFRAEDIDAMEDGWVGLQPPQEGHWYVSAWDIGRRADPTVGITVDCTKLPFQVVAYERLVRAPYAQSEACIDARAEEYGGETWVESNSVGDPVLEALSYRARPFNTNTTSKQDALTKLVRHVERGQIKCGVREVLSELKSYQWEDKGLVQDSVISLAIALHRPERRWVLA